MMSTTPGPCLVCAWYGDFKGFEVVLFTLGVRRPTSLHSPLANRLPEAVLVSFIGGKILWSAVGAPT